MSRGLSSASVNYVLSCRCQLSFRLTFVFRQKKTGIDSPKYLSCKFEDADTKRIVPSHSIPLEPTQLKRCV